MDAVLNVRKRQWAYIFFSLHLLVILSQWPSAILQSNSVFAVFAIPAKAGPMKAGPVKASARVTAKVAIRIFMTLSPYAEITAVPELTFGKLCSANTDLIVG